MKDPINMGIIPQAAPGLRFARFGADINESIQRTLISGCFVSGQLVKEFENELAIYLSVQHVVSCNSGTDALFMCLRGLEIGLGDEVIIPSLTATGTAMAVVRTGATPQFADVALNSRNIDVASIRSVMSPSVKAIIVVHLHGAPVEMDSILDFASSNGIDVIEDCAQAIGARYNGQAVGTLGTAGAFSFYPTKNLGCLGDGGAVVTDNTDLADTVRSIGNNGWDSEKICIREGINSRLDELQASVLSTLLPHVDAGNAERVAAARRYDAALIGSNIKPPPSIPGSVYHQYAVEVEDRDTLVDNLASCEIDTGFHYKKGLHEEPFFQQFFQQDQQCPNTEFLTRCLMSLPIQPELIVNLGNYILTAQSRLDI